MTRERGTTMGTLVYGFGQRVAIDDRTLEHIRIAVTLLLRRGESFMLRLRARDDAAQSRALWVSPAIPLDFVMDAAEQQAVNSDWVRVITGGKDASGTVTVVPEEQVAGILTERRAREAAPATPAGGSALVKHARGARVGSGSADARVAAAAR